MSLRPNSLSQLYEKDYHALALEHAVLMGFWPFRVGRFQTFVDFDLDFNAYRLMLEFPDIDLIFRFRFERDEILDTQDPRQAEDRLGLHLCEAIRNRETAPVPDTIILGED